jgi:predicted MPP superfamily phosphohydrolase
MTGLRARVFSHFPGNQLFDLQVNEKSLAIARLPAALDGLRIVHLSDLHLSDRLTIDYFHCVAKLVRKLDADLIVVSGDICDNDACVSWLAKIFAGVQARYGNYFVLGNHDLRLSSLRLVRDALDDARFIDVGGKCVFAMIERERVLIAGNERPWIKLPADFESTLQREMPRASFRLLVSHSPDQFAWAQQHGFDLVLAGHTHGGQVCFPLIGPVVCPSRFNVRYASGVFHEGKTLMHVSRGSGSLFPLRLNCQPEIAVVVLTQARAVEDN